MDNSNKLNFGILGTARIAKNALIKPAQLIHNVNILAIASRDMNTASEFANKHKLPKKYGSYEDLLRDSEIDSVYIPLPNGLHAEWAIKAMRAGKHVLCEKPVASNTTEALEIKKVVDETGLIFAEAFHYRYHPLMKRVMEIVQSAEIGKINKVEASMCFPLPNKNDIRFQYDIGGGATMDAGCYTINIIRTLAQNEPEVVDAKAIVIKEQIDIGMKANLQFPNDIHGKIECAILKPRKLSMSANIKGERGSLKIINPVAPHLFHRMKIKHGRKTRWEKVNGKSTYYHQLLAFQQAVHTNTPMITDINEAIKNMKVIDAIYEKAGLKLR
ncbi:MAG: Gfo/Idh/MocA family protein [Promethearchaeota archaeon]